MNLGHKLPAHSGTALMERPLPTSPRRRAEAQPSTSDPPLLLLHVLLLELCLTVPGRAVRGVRNDLQGFGHETETVLP